MKQDMILILDLGSEENPQIAREIRARWVSIRRFIPMILRQRSCPLCPMSRVLF